jgi:predicted aldo/keto reductase-like oxidoreductase
MLAANCIACGECLPKCSQGINISELMKELEQVYQKLKKDTIDND